jgi:quinol monooxygenase YgiN
MEFMIEMKAVPGKFQELYQTLQALLPMFRKEEGCRDCKVFRDIEDGEVFFLSVDWDTKESLETYARSASCSALLGAVDLLSSEARVRFGQDSAWEGIDSLKRIRKGMSPSSLE